MSIAVVHSRTLTIGMALPVTVEVHLANGLPGCAIVGLPDAEVRESRERVRAALHHCGFTFPPRRITVNLAPADVPKASGGFDLPIALGILVASGQLPENALRDAVFVGELSLNGELREIRGAFALGCSTVGDLPLSLYLPRANALEAAYVSGSCVYGASDLPALCAHLRGERSAQIARTPAPAHAACADAGSPDADTTPPSALAGRGDRHAEGASADGSVDRDDVRDPNGLPDLADVIGQAAARRGLEVAAAGGHHMLMIGPPGAGKSMLAARLPGILPPMSDAEALSSASLLSSTARFDPAMWRRRPFRAPHHSASAAALVGGGNPPRPGEVSLAHNGVLFLDELTEFDRRTLDMLREPLETGHITISRAGNQAHFPAACQLVSAMNPCPCGYAGDPSGRCRCTESVVQRYQAKLSGPLLDRIDMRMTLTALTPQELLAGKASGPQDRSHPIRRRGNATTHDDAQDAQEGSAAVRARVLAARRRQWSRQGCANARLDAAQLGQHCQLDEAGRTLLGRAMQRFQWSARGHHRVLRLARTIADLDGAAMPGAQHVAEAVQYRKTGD